MNLEKYVVVFEDVLDVISDMNSVVGDQEVILGIEDKFKKTFIQYAETVGVEGYNSFTSEILDQISIFAQKDSQFLVIGNIHEDSYFIMLKSTKDVIELKSGNVLVIPNHIIFQYAVKEDCSFQNNLVGYVNLFNKEDVPE